MARFKGLMIYRKTLAETPVVLGQMILCPDTRELFFDSSDADRVQITDTLWLSTNEERESITPIENKIYIVRESCHLWTFVNGEWCDLTNQTDVSDEIEEGVNTPITSDAVYKALILKADVNSPKLTGEPKTTTPSKDDNSTRIASTEFIKMLLEDYVPRSGAPEFDESPKAPTPPERDNSTNIATTEFVQREIQREISVKADKTITKEVILLASGWNSDKTYLINLADVKIDNPIIVGPDPSDMSNYGLYGVKCISQGDATLTFSCDITPKEDITVNVFIFG